MSAFLDRPGFALIGVVVWVVVLVLVIGRLDRVLPRNSKVEGWVRRWASAGQSLAVVGGLIAAIRVLFETDVVTWRWLTLGVVAATAWASRRALSDWANGIALRTEGTLRVGGRIAVGKGRGRIRRLGLRSAEVEAEDGRVMRLPYTGLAEVNIEISSEEVAARSHTFAVDIAGVADASELRERLVSGALLSPWSSAEPVPTARVLEQTDGRVRVEVTVYPVDAAFASRVEDAVRASVETPDGS